MIAVLDLAAAPPAALAARIDDGRRFFALPDATTRRWHIDARHRGFDPIGWQALAPDQPPDLNGSFDLGVETLAPDPWPDEALLPGFRAARCGPITAGERLPAMCRKTTVSA